MKVAKPCQQLFDEWIRQRCEKFGPTFLCTYQVMHSTKLEIVMAGLSMSPWWIMTMHSYCFNLFTFYYKITKAYHLICLDNPFCIKYYCLFFIFVSSPTTSDSDYLVVVHIEKHCGTVLCPESFAASWSRTLLKTLGTIVLYKHIRFHSMSRIYVHDRRWK